MEGDQRVLAADISPFSPDAKGSIREIILPKGLDLDRPKRTRTSFTAEQLYRLEMEFQRCQYVVGRERTELARQLNLSETQVPAAGPHTALHQLALPHLARASQGGGGDRENGEERSKAFSSTISPPSPPPIPSKIPGPVLCPPWPSPRGQISWEFDLDSS